MRPEPVDRTGFPEHQAVVFRIMADGQWHTLEDVAEQAKIQYPSTVASRLRDFAGNVEGEHNKGYSYERRTQKGTRRTFEYRLIMPSADNQLDLLACALAGA